MILCAIVYILTYISISELGPKPTIHASDSKTLTGQI